MRYVIWLKSEKLHRQFCRSSNCMGSVCDRGQPGLRAKVLHPSILERRTLSTTCIQRRERTLKGGCFMVFVIGTEMQHSRTRAAVHLVGSVTFGLCLLLGSYCW